MQRLTLSIDILKFFRELFDYFKENIGEYFKDPAQRPPVFWTFHPNSVFRRFSNFVERLNTIQWCEYSHTHTILYRFLKISSHLLGFSIQLRSF